MTFRAWKVWILNSVTFQNLYAPRVWERWLDARCSDDRRSRVVRRQVLPALCSVADSRQTFSGAHFLRQRQCPAGSVDVRVRSADTSEWLDSHWTRRQVWLVWSALCCSASDSDSVPLCWRNCAATDIRSGMDGSSSVILAASPSVRNDFTKQLLKCSLDYFSTVIYTYVHYSNWCFIVTSSVVHSVASMLRQTAANIRCLFSSM